MASAVILGEVEEGIASHRDDMFSSNFFILETILCLKLQIILFRIQSCDLWWINTQVCCKRNIQISEFIYAGCIGQDGCSEMRFRLYRDV